MLKTSQWQAYLATKEPHAFFSWLYPDDADAQICRYSDAITEFECMYGEREVALFSASGRTELGGNHTDHQHGTVLAAAVTMDMIAVVSPRSDNIINFASVGFKTDIVNLGDLAVHNDEANKSAALIRGVCARMNQLGYSIGGFDCYQTSNVLKGSGLSSSAAFEVLVGTIENILYNDGKIAAPEIAKISQYAENVYFGKPCGLMDQMASAVGSVVSIDFSDIENPVVEQIPCDLAKYGYELCIVNAGGSHANLTEEYSSIPAEMKTVAEIFGKQYLVEVDENKFFQKLGQLRGAVSDRALLRAIHFFADNRHAKLERDTLKIGDIDMFMRLVNESGRSSFNSLQNCFPSNTTGERSVALALVMSEHALRGTGACRVHGGGFAGTILAVVPLEGMDSYVAAMESIFGENCCFPLFVRPTGGIMIPEPKKQ